MSDLHHDGVRIHHEVTGGGPALLLTHGFGATSRMFDANVAALAEEHTVIAWDVRGHGASGCPADPALYSVALSMGDMAALLDHAGAEQAVVAGHSLGGYLSLEFLLARPERVRALVLIATGPGFRKAESRDAWNRMAERYATEHDGGGLAHAARGILTQRDGHVIEALPEIRVPTLVVVGERDADYMPGSRYMAGKIPGAQLVVVPGAGHAPGVSHPEPFNAAVRDFLDRLPRPRSAPPA